MVFLTNCSKIILLVIHISSLQFFLYFIVFKHKCKVLYAIFL